MNGVDLGDIEHIFELVQGGLELDQIVQIVPVTGLRHEAA